MTEYNGLSLVEDYFQFRGLHAGRTQLVLKPATTAEINEALGFMTDNNCQNVDRFFERNHIWDKEFRQAIDAVHKLLKFQCPRDSYIVPLAEVREFYLKVLRFVAAFSLDDDLSA